MGTFVPQVLLGLTQSLAAFLVPGLIVFIGAPVMFWIKIFLVCCLLRSCLLTRSAQENMCRGACPCELFAGDFHSEPEARSAGRGSTA